jgi:hypothetical protein
MELETAVSAESKRLFIGGLKTLADITLTFDGGLASASLR